jgi:uncharacterized membrane protein YgdD (TMEM256/DUF423 family)
MEPPSKITTGKSTWLAVGALIGASGVALGAFGAHGLAEALANMGYETDEVARRLANFETAVRYQMHHAIALAIVGLLHRERPRKTWHFAAAAFLLGILLFSGLLYVLTFTGPNFRRLGAVVPLGGVSLIVGWLALAVGACKS